MKSENGALTSEAVCLWAQHDPTPIKPQSVCLSKHQSCRPLKWHKGTFFSKHHCFLTKALTGSNHPFLSGLNQLWAFESSRTLFMTASFSFNGNLQYYLEDTSITTKRRRKHIRGQSKLNFGCLEKSANREMKTNIEIDVIKCKAVVTQWPSQSFWRPTDLWSKGSKGPKALCPKNEHCAYKLLHTHTHTHTHMHTVPTFHAVTTGLPSFVSAAVADKWHQSQSQISFLS